MLGQVCAHDVRTFYSKIEDCNNKLERIGSVSHFLEAIMAVGVCTLCIYLLIVFCRLCSLHTLNLGAMDIREMKIKTKCEQTVMVCARAQNTGKCRCCSIWRRQYWPSA
jgi:hypothetical protein